MQSRGQYAGDQHDGDCDAMHGGAQTRRDLFALSHPEQTPQADCSQSRGIEQVNKAVAQMDQVTHQNAALVQQASAAALR
ncbi:hypothetical protein WI88_03635 [Burkholderia ubonensis]|nr:hypothetical protein [Burkholderia ubonensis]KVD71039.1 hypothetical protein WI88_03635 [Burkholderia ubonensis]